MPSEAEERYERNIKVIEEFRRTGDDRRFRTDTAVDHHRCAERTGTHSATGISVRWRSTADLWLARRLGQTTRLVLESAQESVVTVEVGSEQYQATATALEGEERDRLFARQKEAMPVFAEYESRTKRVIPVIALERTT